jgi:hypothetical protein
MGATQQPVPPATEQRNIEARLTFMRETGTVEVEMFDTVRDAKAWIARRLRQLDAEGFATDAMHIRREVSLLAKAVAQ